MPSTRRYQAINERKSREKKVDDPKKGGEVKAKIRVFKMHLIKLGQIPFLLTENLLFEHA